MPTRASHDLTAFVAALRDDTFFAQAGRSFALLKPGDWEGLRRWAESFGYTFTLHQLHELCGEKPNILGQLSKSSHLSGWTLESLNRAAHA